MRALRARVAAETIISTLLENHVVEIVQNVERSSEQSLSKGSSADLAQSKTSSQGSSESIEREM